MEIRELPQALLKEFAKVFQKEFTKEQPEKQENKEKNRKILTDIVNWLRKIMSE